MHIENVLSTFDGMSCGQLALGQAGITYSNYFASEIDPAAIKVAQKNYPATVQLGDITKISYRDGWLITPAGAKYVGEIGLFIGGSPCQSFSNAGDKKGFEGKSGLFYHWLRLLREVRAYNPECEFLLENVKMKKEWRNIISEAVGVEPVLINSALVSAQNRERYYWSSITEIQQPEDKGILLADILEDEVDEKYHHSLTCFNYMNEKLKDGRIRWDLSLHSDTANRKSVCIPANLYKGQPYNVLIDRRVPKFYRDGRAKENPYKASTFTAGANSAGNHSDTDWVHAGGVLRRYTPVEAERLQTLPDNYTEGVSNSQRYKMIGNGWTVAVIAHIFSHLKK